MTFKQIRDILVLLPQHQGQDYSEQQVRQKACEVLQQMLVNKLNELKGAN